MGYGPKPLKVSLKPPYLPCLHVILPPYVYLLLGILGLFLSPTSFAEQVLKSHYLNIKNKPLAEVVKEFSVVFNIPFAVNSDLADSQLVINIQGEYPLDAALDSIFQETPITYEISEFGVMIVPRPVLEATQELPAIDKITVTGIRGTLKRARDIKYTTTEISDAIAAEDMGNYSDINIAESLQGIPGVTITREAGEGRQLSLRGTLPDFTQVTLNNMPVLANNDSPMDSREQKQRDRSFDFNVFSSELFNQAQVLKAYSVEQVSGGLAGTVALQTSKPFDQPGFNLIFSPQIGYNQYSEGLAKSFTGLISNTWGNWGYLLSASYGTREAEERGANTFRWRPTALPQSSLTLLPEALQASLQSGDVIMPKGNRYSVWRSAQSRLGVSLALQYQDPKTSITFDVLHALLDSDRTEYHLYPRGDQSTPIIVDQTKVLDVEINSNQELVYGLYENARVATESRAQQTQTDYNQVVLNAKTAINDNLSVALVAGIEDSNFDIPLSNKIYTKGQSNLSVDYRADRFFADIHYDNDLLAADMWQMQEIDLEEYSAHTRYQHAEISFEHQLKSGFSAKWGGEYTQFSNASISLYQDNLLKDNWAAFANGVALGELDEHGAISRDNTLPQHLVTPLYAHPKVNWLRLQTNTAIEYFGIDPFHLTNNSLEITQLQNETTETKKSAFVLMSWGNTDLDAKFGLRLQQEKVKVNYHLTTGDFSSAKTHQTLLPSINLSWEFEPDWLIRAGVSRNTARPSLNDLSSAPTYLEDSNTLLGLNDSLAPYISNNLDLALEGYIQDNILFSFSAFYKRISDFIATKSETIRFADTGLANILPTTNLSSDSLVKLVTKDNHESASLSGIETMLAYEWSHLPAPWKNIGMIGQYTFTNGSMNYYNELTGEKLFRKAFPYLSKQTASVTLYYETDLLSTRISATYRDKYIHQVNSQTLNEEDETGFHATVYIDASLAYQLSPQWQFKIQAQNLSNQREEQYSDSADRAYNSVTSGRTYYLGLTYQY